MCKQEVVAMADRRLGYAEISRLRQDEDLDAVVAWIPDSAGSLLDVACGSGSLLARAIKSRSNIRRIFGVDISEERIGEAAVAVSTPGVSSEFRVMDLADPYALGSSFDVVTMTSALHWIFPNEAALFGWIAKHLKSNGLLLMTTYRPSLSKHGDSVDGLANEAFRSLGYSDLQTKDLLIANRVVPLGTRCAPNEDLRAKFGSWFEVEELDTKEVKVATNGAKEFRDFHVATYGRYFSRIAGAEKEAQFFDEIGKIAAARMAADGYVAAMQVNLWRLRKRDPLKVSL